MGLINDDPVWPSCRPPKFAEFGHQVCQKSRSFGGLNRQQVYHHVRIWLCQEVDDLAFARELLCVPDGDSIAKFAIVAFRINDAKLKCKFAHLLQKRSHNG
jgi:hypothetical protein